MVRLAALLWLCAAWGAEAQCRLALAVGIDISSSVDAEEDRLQRQGLARALGSDAVRRAALALSGEPVALAVFEWSGRWQQDLILDWTFLRTDADITAAADIIARSQRSYQDFPTAAGYALGYASGLLARAPVCLFRTLDLSGDGVNNDGFPPNLAYQNFDFDGVTVNGLPITGHDDTVVTFYANDILHGPGAFYEVADGFDDFERAMRTKLEREMGVLTLGEAQ
ncbi:DUF1194 domain-containing protein [Palleronia abyssalis]|uniref:VWFA domain-containing protein n=1 Tax=Palleronia abyssalis TaxID=1501240 RepID=A0A2R8BXR4_9RHOB|nr:DUF1194 domain-containing protein [Palleronia abyssalis]SPJ24866.1 hypothetical protein PAA8504_02707 [Palleronia abyssalis]